MIRSENVLISKISVCLFSTIWNCSATIGDPRYFKSYHFRFCSLLRPERNNKRHFGITWILHKLIQATDLFSMALRSSCSQIFFKISVCKIFDKFSQENNCVVVFLNKVTGLQVFTPLQLFLCFCVKFSEFLITYFLQNTSDGCFWELIYINVFWKTCGFTGC